MKCETCGGVTDPTPIDSAGYDNGPICLCDLDAAVGRDQAIAKAIDNQFRGKEYEPDWLSIDAGTICRQVERAGYLISMAECKGEILERFNQPNPDALRAAGQLDLLSGGE